MSEEERRAVRALVVAEEEDRRRLFSSLLRSAGHVVTACPDAESAWMACRNEPHHLVILDLDPPGGEGLELCRRIRALPRGGEGLIVVITGIEGPSIPGEVLEAGADDYVSGPADAGALEARLAIAERRLAERLSLRDARKEITRLEEQTRSLRSFGDLLGHGPAMQDVFRRLRLAAESDVTVLITGEPGTGKDLAARAVHLAGARSQGPFVAVTCTGIPETLLESEIFGHVRGAFPGAVSDKTSAFQAAKGGTLFLEEVGDLSPFLQLRLLRVLQEREVRGMGEESPSRVNVRLISSTHRDLGELPGQGAVREDFYRGISGFEIPMPPLRERLEDLPDLAEHFLAHLRASTGRQIKGFTREASRKLRLHSWPGNVRELRNALEHAFDTVRGDRIGASDLPPEVGDPRLRTVTGAMARGGSERGRILEALRETRGNRTRAAQILGISRVTLWKRLRSLNIDASKFRPAAAASRSDT